MEQTEENQSSDSSPKTYGYVVGRKPEDQEHPDKK